MKLRQLFGRAFFLVAYPLYYRKKLRKSDECRLFGFSLVVLPGVFHPGLFFSTAILGAYLQRLELRGKRVLEIGVGSGLLSLIVAEKGAAVTGVDINPSAVECTRRNLERNGLSASVDVLQSDLFEQVPADKPFDFIVWNPPFFPKEATDDASRAWNAGEDYSTLRRCADGSGAYLSASGRIILILTTNHCDVEKVLGIFRGSGFSSTIVKTKKSFFETFSVVEMRRG